MLDAGAGELLEWHTGVCGAVDELADALLACPVDEAVVAVAELELIDAVISASPARGEMGVGGRHAEDVTAGLVRLASLEVMAGDEREDATVTQVLVQAVRRLEASNALAPYELFLACDALAALLDRCGRLRQAHDLWLLSFGVAYAIDGASCGPCVSHAAWELARSLVRRDLRPHGIDVAMHDEGLFVARMRVRDLVTAMACDGVQGDSAQGDARSAWALTAWGILQAFSLERTDLFGDALREVEACLRVAEGAWRSHAIIGREPLAVTLYVHGSLLELAGRHGEARERLLGAVDVLRSADGKPAGSGHHELLARALSQAARLTDDRSARRHLYAEACRAWLHVDGRGRFGAWFQEQVHLSLELARLMLDDDPSATCDLLAELVEGFASVPGMGGGDGLPNMALAALQVQVLALLSAALEGAGRATGARRTFDEALDVCDRQLRGGRKSSPYDLLWVAADDLDRAARHLLATTRPEEAERLAQRAVMLYRRYLSLEKDEWRATRLVAGQEEALATLMRARQASRS